MFRNYGNDNGVIYFTLLVNVQLIIVQTIKLKQPNSVKTVIKVIT